jgi:GntR family transcriptional regulator/MocR family aminotransferase
LDFQVRYDSYLLKYNHKSEALFQALKDDIVSGRLEYGTRLPASRMLAQRYGLSRGTVNLVYDRLSSQGYTRSQIGSGTYIMYKLDKPSRLNNLPDSNSRDYHQPSMINVSEWGRRLIEQPLLSSLPVRSAAASKPSIDFLLGKVDLSYFPAREWNRYMYEQVRSSYERQQSSAFQTGGYGPLRESIALHLRRTRGVVADPGDIAIVNGSQQALTLLVQLMINPGDPVILEDPHYLGIRRAVQAAGGLIYPQSVDREGIVIRDDGNDAFTDARLLITTTGRQFPTGAVLSMERRLKLLRWAKRADALIIEDDYDSEFRFKGRPLEPLKSLDQADKVAFVGTFSRTMIQDLRIGYAVLPKGLTGIFMKAKQLFEPHPSSILEQRALAAFMSSGLYEKHLRRMRRVYKKRFEVIHELLQEHLSDVFDIHDADGGLHVYAEWKHTPTLMDKYIQLCEARGATFVDCRNYYMSRSIPAACFGFAHLDEQKLAEGVKRLRAAVEGL